MGTKFVVVHLRQVIKVGIAVLILIGLLIFLFSLILGKNDTKPSFNPGTYVSEIVLHNNPVQVSVTVSNDEILEINMEPLNETQAVFYPVFETKIEEIASEIVALQSTELVEDNSVTGQILVSAVDKALSYAVN